MAENFDKLMSVFQDALEKYPPKAWDRFVREASGGDEVIYRKACQLLQSHANGDSLLDRPVVAASLTLDQPITEKPGNQIGQYKLLEQIGEGGFGVVFLAEQDKPVRRRVALKVIKPGMDTREVIARFQAERQALAMMDHPNIARVYDAGATENGRPYFVMELVQGVPITEYCDECNLSTLERLELFITVCQAVQHAHQKGIIHRDLKPTNVLVASQDGRHGPKIIDFGVAKAVEQRLTEHTQMTAFAQMVGTPLYMSPEQAELSPLGVDTRSDIYSLGVVLYELLSGTTPFDKERLHALSYDELRRIIREEEPPRPIARFCTLAADMATTVAARRRSDVRRLEQTVRGELDWIVMKCLEKDRNRRYETPNSLARDIERYLHDEPVQACPPWFGYRLQKFIRRNKAGVLAAAAVIVAMTVGLALATVGFVRARTEAARSYQVAQFLKDMLKAAGPGVARGRDATLLREILEQTAKRVEIDLAGNPLIQGDLWYTLGTTYAEIGDIPRAIMLYQHAVDSYRSALGRESTKLALALARLGASQSFMGDVASGKANAQLGLQMARSCGHSETLATCLVLTAHSYTAWGKGGEDSVPYLREALGLYQRVGSDPIAAADCMRSLAMAVIEIDNDEAQSLQLEALELHRKHLGPDHPMVAADLFGLGQLLLNAAKADEAESVLVQSLDAFRKIHTPNHPHRSVVLRFVVQALALNGKWEQAEALIQEELQASPSNPRNLNLLGALKATKGEWSAAIVPFSRAVEVTPADDVDCDHSWFNLAVSHLRSGNQEEYRRHCHEYLALPRSNESAENNAAAASLLLPVDGTDFDRACELADSDALNAPRNPWRALAKALAELRRKRFTSAKDWADRILNAECSPLYKASAGYLKAIAYVRLQQLESARDAFALGDRLGQPSHHINIPLFWGSHDWTVADTLRHEAVELIESAQSQPDDKAPNSEMPAPTND